MSVYEIDGIIFEQHYNDSNSRFVKIINHSGEDLVVQLDFFIGSIKNPILRHKNKYKIKNDTWYCPSDDLFGYTHFELTINDEYKGIVPMIKEKNKIPIEDRVFCLGLNKTSTTSISDDLENLGFNTFPNTDSLFNGYLALLFNDNIGTFIDFVENTKFTFFNDVPISTTVIGKKLIRYTPNSKFILSVRNNPELWVKSVKKFFHEYIEDNKLNPYKVNIDSYSFYGDSNFNIYGYLSGLFESWDLDRFEGSLDEKLYKFYLNHNREIRKELIKHNCEWIEIDASKQGELKRLTDFLGVYNTKENFVHINKS